MFGPRIPKHPPAGFGQRHAMNVPPEQKRSAALLEGLQLLAERRLLGLEPACGGGDAPPWRAEKYSSCSFISREIPRPLSGGHRDRR